MELNKVSTKVMIGIGNTTIISTFEDEDGKLYSHHLELCTSNPNEIIEQLGTICNRNFIERKAGEAK